MRKKGLSEIVAYVILVVIAISMSILVYAWLKSYIPGQGESCPEGVSLIIESYECNSTKNTITLKLKNTGTFNLNGAIARISNETGKLPIYSLGAGQIDFKQGLAPKNSTNFIVSNYSRYNSITTIEIEPFRIDNKIILCENRIIRQEIEGCE